MQSNRSLDWVSNQELLNTKLHCQTPDWNIWTLDIRVTKNASTLLAIPPYNFVQRSTGFFSVTYWRGLGGTRRGFRYILPDMTTVAVLTILFSASVIFVIWSFTLDLHIMSSRYIWQAGEWETRFQLQNGKHNGQSSVHSWHYHHYIMGSQVNTHDTTIIT